MDKFFALVDCNNFYVSCERVFDPSLKNKPVVVLSNNDGCIISRSNEAKLLNIPMGAPLHLYKNIIDSNKVKSNILYCRLDTDVIGEDEFLNLCKKENILFFKYPSGDYRLVTHSGINKDDIKLTLSIFEKILS